VPQVVGVVFLFVDVGTGYVPASPVATGWVNSQNKSPPRSTRPLLLCYFFLYPPLLTLSLLLIFKGFVNMRVPQEVLVNFNRGVLPLENGGRRIVYTHN